MSRKKTQPKKVVTPDPIFKSTIIPKLINSIMFDGKKVVAEKIVYEAIEKIKSKTKEEPINVFNEAINNIKMIIFSFWKNFSIFFGKLPCTSRCSRSNCNTSFLFLFHPIHCCGPIVDFTNFMAFASII